MGERPGYGGFLAYHYRLYYPSGLIRSRKNGQTVYFRDVTKGAGHKAFTVLLYIAAVLLLISPLLYFILSEDYWLQCDYAFMIFPLMYALYPLILSLRYWSSSFESVPPERVVEIKEEKNKKLFLNSKLSIALLVALFVPQMVIFFIQSFTGAYIRYSIDIAANNQVNRPEASALVFLGPEPVRLGKSVLIAKGYVPVKDNAVEVRLDVTNSPYGPSVLFNGEKIDQYKTIYCRRSHYLLSDHYFEYDYDYKIPASLFRPVNTFQVQSGYAKGDWTIEIVPSGQ